MGTEAFTVRADSKKVRQLDKLAKLEHRSRNYLVNQAIDQLLEMQAWQVERTKEGNKLPRSKLSRGARLRYAKRGITLCQPPKIMLIDNHYGAFDTAHLDL